MEPPPEGAHGTRPYWSLEADEVLASLGSSHGGLTGAQAEESLRRHGPNTLHVRKGEGRLAVLIRQFRSPIILLLMASAILSAFLRDTTDALIILAIVVMSGLLQFREEVRASDLVHELVRMVQVRVRAVRDGGDLDVPIEEIVPGDIVILSAGSLIPGDCLLLDAKSLHADEAVLTGETFPAEKVPGPVDAGVPPSGRRNALFMGTHVTSGTGRALVVATGSQTQFGKMAQRLRIRPPETDFEKGIRRFGAMIMEMTLLFVIAIFALNVYLAKPWLDSFLFALALAVGFTPQLLPAIVGITLSRGARDMAALKVVVKHLPAIENFGSMNVLCSDKTGTLTEGKVVLDRAIGASGEESAAVLQYAAVNAAFESGYGNPIDDAVRERTRGMSDGWRKLDEVPYDFIRKRLSIAAARGDEVFLVTKGAVEKVLDVCTDARVEGGRTVPLAQARGPLTDLFRTLSERGHRVLAVAVRRLDLPGDIGREDERDMTLFGFLVFSDPPKVDAGEAVAALKAMGVAFKIITGDNRYVARSVAEGVGIADPVVLTGRDVASMGDEALMRRAVSTDIFAEVDPNQKERIVLALKKAGNVVGYMGDGINDATALHTADAGISVDTAVDVLKQAADIILLEKDLSVLAAGVQEGRKILANTLKYVQLTTSANFGNMFSMAFVSPFLPFLPLLPKQILLNNFLTDIPAMTIADDRIDPELTRGPRRWDISGIRRFMLAFGLQSSLFDFLTFLVLIRVLGASPGQFRTGWFLESAISEILILLVIRTRRPFYRSPPGLLILISGSLMSALAVAFVLPPFRASLGFESIPPSYALALTAILASYVAAAELTKRLLEVRSHPSI